MRRLASRRKGWTARSGPPDALLRCAHNVEMAGARGRCQWLKAGGVARVQVRSVVRRFGNPLIADTTERVNTDASLNYLLDPLRDCVAADRPAPILSLAVAAWIRRSAGRDDAGRSLPVSNPTAAAFERQAARSGRDPESMLSHRQTFGELGELPAFRREVGRWLRRMELEGTAGALAALLEETGAG